MTPSEIKSRVLAELPTAEVFIYGKNVSRDRVVLAYDKATDNLSPRITVAVLAKPHTGTPWLNRLIRRATAVCLVDADPDDTLVLMFGGRDKFDEFRSALGPCGAVVRAS